MRRLAPLLVLLAACSPRPHSNPPPVHLDCNPAGESCLLPFPSSVFEVVDTSTATGLAVDLPAAASFAGLKGSYDWEQPDGFSAIGSIAAYLPAGGAAPARPRPDPAAHHPPPATSRSTTPPRSSPPRWSPSSTPTPRRRPGASGSP